MKEAFRGLLEAVGKIAIEEGEEWRIRHSELMDSYEEVLIELGEIEGSIFDGHEWVG